MHKDTKSKSYLHYYYFLIIIFYLSFGKCITLFPQGYWGRGFYSTAGYWNVKVMRNDFWIWTRTFYIRSISYTEQGRSMSYLNLLDLKYLIIIIIIFSYIQQYWNFKFLQKCEYSMTCWAHLWMYFYFHFALLSNSLL